MPRKPTILSDSYPYHIYNRSNNKEKFYLDLDRLWAIYLEQLKLLSVDYSCEVISFVLMPNHYHLLIQTPKANIGEAMHAFNKNSSKVANRICRRVNHFYGGRYKWSLISTKAYLSTCYKYVYRNPVKAKLCNSVQEYKYSTLNTKPPFISKLYNYLPEDFRWLNTPFCSELDEIIAKGLNKRQFKLSRYYTGKKPILDLPVLSNKKETKP